MISLLYTGTSALIIFPTSREQRNIVHKCTKIGDACDYVDETYKTNKATYLPTTSTTVFTVLKRTKKTIRKQKIQKLKNML